MIRGLHGLFYSSDPEGSRAFLRDSLRLPATDVGDGWLIFDLPEGDLGVHPVDTDDAAAVGTHNVSFYCDDIHGTVKDLAARGVRFTGPVEDHGYGLVTHFEIPGGLVVQLYEPRYVKAAAKRPASKKVDPKKASKKSAPKKSKRANPTKPVRRASRTRR